MADNVTTQTAALATIPDATKVATDQLAGGEHVQYVKLMDGTLDGSTKAAVNATGLRVDASGAAVPVTDNAGSLTVDAPVATPVATRLSDGAAFIDPRDVSDRAARLVGVVSGAANVFHVDDNAGSLTVDAPVATPVATRLSDGAAFIDPRDVSDRAARLVGVVSGAANVFHVDDNSGSLTVDAPVGTPVFARLSDGAAALVGQKAMAASLPVTIASDQSAVPISAASLPLPTGAATQAGQTDGSFVAQTRSAILCVTNTAATGVACTLTIPAVAAQFHYITLIEIQLYATAARTGGATPILVTTTNLPGSPVWDFDTAQAIGVTIRQNSNFSSPLRSSTVNTATTIVAPIATTGIWRITAYYYAAI